jgi:ESCRT-II complex subunit VPS22
MWNELLGFGDFYYELGVQLVEACLGSRPLNGGLMELGQLRAAVERRRGSRSDPVSEDDIVRAIRKLKVGSGEHTMWVTSRACVCHVLCMFWVQAVGAADCLLGP